jgi:hypothetical protein
MKHTRSKLRGIVRLIHSFAASCGEFDPPWIKMTELDMDAVRQPHSEEDGKTPLDHEANALAVSYGHVTTHITEFAKLQYQLVGVAYALAGAILTFLGGGTAKPQLILFFPVIFCGIVWVQLYLHSNIKSYGRYLNFKLRPRMEEIINTGIPIPKRQSIWDWEDYYDSLLATAQTSSSLWQRVRQVFSPKTAVRLLSVFIVVLPLIPAGLTYLLYPTYVPTASVACISIPVINFTFATATLEDCTALRVDTVIIAITLALFILVYMANQQWSAREKARISAEEKDELLETIKQLQKRGKFPAAEEIVQLIKQKYPSDKSLIQRAIDLAASEDLVPSATQAKEPTQASMK